MPENSELILQRADQLEATARQLKQVASERKWLRRGGAVFAGLAVILLASNVWLNVSGQRLAHRIFNCTSSAKPGKRNCPADKQSEAFVSAFADSTRRAAAAASWCAIYGPAAGPSPTYSEVLACTRNLLPATPVAPFAPTPTPTP